MKIKKIGSKIISCLLCVAILVSGFSIGTFAATEYTYGDYTYTVVSGEAVITAFTETVSGSVSVPSSINGYNVTKIDSYAFYACTTMTSVTLPNTVKTIGSYTFAYCTSLNELHIPLSVTSIGNKAFFASNNITDVYYSGTEADWKKISVSSGNEKLTSAEIHYAAKDIYNLGEETYSFDNYGDSDSAGGHCFGMSMTSSGYYLNILDIADAGGNKKDDVIALKENSKTKKPICHYQALQGIDLLQSSIVAGCSFWMTYGWKWLKLSYDGEYDIDSDWSSLVNYVKNHKYDGEGNLQILYSKKNGGAHAINFLRYEEVSGQQRIYAYDNNFPDEETYFYKSSSGKIYQAPNSTFSGNIDCIGILYVPTYFSVLGDSAKYIMSRYIYAESNEIYIEDAVASPIAAGPESDKNVVLKVPDTVPSVTITPLVDNATFEYLGKEYSFGKVDEDTVGILTLAESEDDTETPKLEIVSSTISIQSPSRTTIRCKDSIYLYPIVDGGLPEDTYIYWETSNDNFDVFYFSDDSIMITSQNNGYTDITVYLLNYEDDSVIDSYTIEMYSKAGFFDKIGGFFRSLFGMTKIYKE